LCALGADADAGPGVPAAGASAASAPCTTATGTATTAAAAPVAAPFRNCRRSSAGGPSFLLISKPPLPARTLPQHILRSSCALRGPPASDRYKGQDRSNIRRLRDW